MHAACVSTISPPDLPTHIPLSIEQRSSRSSSLIKLCLVAPAALVLLSPFILLAGHMTGNALVRAHLAEHPGALLQLLLGLAFWTVLFAWPLKRMVESLGRARTVEIGPGTVHVTELSLFGETAWQEPLAAYAGVAHHIRASLSGVRHELLLVHPDPDRTVLVALAPRLSQVEIDTLCRLLGRAEIPSRELYKVRLKPGFLGATKPSTRIRDAHA